MTGTGLRSLHEPLGERGSLLLQGEAVHQNVCIFGDSIAAGVGDHTGGGWAERVRHWSAQSLPLHPKVMNLGVPGDRLEDLLDRFERECASRSPIALIIATGINDSHDLPEGPRTGEERFTTMFIDLLERARTVTSRLLVLGPTNVTDGHPAHNFDNRSILRYQAIEQATTVARGIPFVPLHGVIPDSSLAEDGLHPDASGHEIIYESILPTWRSLWAPNPSGTFP